MNTLKKLTQIQKNIVIIFYIIFCLALIFPIWTIFSNLQISFAVNIIVLLFLIALFSLLGSYCYLIVFLPEKLNKNFDGIRNGIAAGRIISMEDFTAKIIDFLVKNFDYIFFDIEYAVIGVFAENEIYISKDLDKSFLPDKEELFKKSKNCNSIQFLGNVKPLGKKSYLYLIPIYFENTYLGFCSVITNRKLGRLFRGILQDLENYYFDDQFMLMYRILKFN